MVNVFQGGFNATQYQPNDGGGGSLPAGQYSVQMVKSDMVQTAAKTGWMLVCDLAIIEGPHVGRKIRTRYNVVNPNPQAVEIAMGELSALSHVIGVLNWTDSQQLHGRPFKVNVDCVERTDAPGKFSNNVVGYLDYMGNPPTPSQSGQVTGGTQAPPPPGQMQGQPPQMPQGMPGQPPMTTGPNMTQSGQMQPPQQLQGAPQPMSQPPQGMGQPGYQNGAPQGATYQQPTGTPQGAPQEGAAYGQGGTGYGPQAGQMPGQMSQPPQGYQDPNQGQQMPPPGAQMGYQGQPPQGQYQQPPQGMSQPPQSGPVAGPGSQPPQGMSQPPQGGQPSYGGQVPPASQAPQQGGYAPQGGAPQGGAPSWATGGQ